MGVKNAVIIRLREVCAARKMKLNALANLAGLTPSTIYSMCDESRKDVGIVTVKILCDALEMSLEEFFDAEIFRALEQEIE
jgi:DNA-binding Xre family transcriptional regulator